MATPFCQARVIAFANRPISPSNSGRALAQRAEEELRAAGALPRRTAVSGRSSLTPSELRVAELASEGLTNREVAQALFVTSKTVQFHLGNVHLKLGVNQRELLAEALDDSDP